MKKLPHAAGVKLPDEFALRVQTNVIEVHDTLTVTEAEAP